MEQMTSDVPAEAPGIHPAAPGRETTSPPAPASGGGRRPACASSPCRNLPHPRDPCQMRDGVPPARGVKYGHAETRRKKVLLVIRCAAPPIPRSWPGRCPGRSMKNRVVETKRRRTGRSNGIVRPIWRCRVHGGRDNGPAMTSYRDLRIALLRVSASPREPLAAVPLVLRSDGAEDDGPKASRAPRRPNLQGRDRTRGRSINAREGGDESGHRQGLLQARAIEEAHAEILELAPSRRRRHRSRSRPTFAPRLCAGWRATSARASCCPTSTRSNIWTAGNMTNSPTRRPLGLPAMERSHARIIEALAGSNPQVLAGGALARLEGRPPRHRQQCAPRRRTGRQ